MLKKKSKISCLFFFVFFLFSAHCTASLSSYTVLGFEKGSGKEAVLAPNELVLSDTKGRSKSELNKLLNKVHPQASFKKSKGWNHYILTPDPVKWQTIMADPELTDFKPVFYKNGRQTPENRMVLMGGIIIRYPPELPDSAVRDIEKEFGLKRIKTSKIKQNIFICRAEDPFTELEKAGKLTASGRVLYAAPNWMRYREKRAVPDDPLFSDQWYLENTGQNGGLAGADINIVSAWDQFQGTVSEVIAIVDDGVEISHEDLKDNIVPGLSYDFVNGDDDPSPETVQDYHGTACAGLAAAKGFNAVGVTGAAPGSGLAGFRLLGAESDVNEAAALSLNMDAIDIYCSSWGPADGGGTIGGPGPLAMDALEDGVTNGRGSFGCIYVWAGGNGYDSDNANYDGYANSRYTIAVSASTNLGSRASFSEKGANILVNAPSDGGSLGITATTLSTAGKYTGAFGGTSASAPLAAGVIALMLQAEPNLSWRDVQHILIQTAEKNDPEDADWTVNGAGFPVNHKYGFGRVDAAAAVNAAQTWMTAMPEIQIEYSSIPNLTIPDNSAEGVSDGVAVSESLKVEYADIYFSADHEKWGDLEITLESPDGTNSILAEQHDNGLGNEYSSWRFGSVRHFGENSKGEWRLTVRDRASGNTGVFEKWALVLYGTIPGNINGDQQIDLADAILALKILAEADGGSEEIYASADIDHDRKIGLSELIYILQRTAELR